MRILIADDEARVRSALRLVLEHETGHELAEAASVEALLSEAPAFRPDLILLDWELARARAVKILPLLRQAWPNAVVVALSGRPEARASALAEGADAFVSKGGDPESLLAVVRALPRK